MLGKPVEDAFSLAWSVSKRGFNDQLQLELANPSLCVGPRLAASVVRPRRTFSTQEPSWQ